MNAPAKTSDTAALMAAMGAAARGAAAALAASSADQRTHALKLLAEQSQFFRQKLVIRIKKGDPFALRFTQAVVARGR